MKNAYPPYSYCSRERCCWRCRRCRITITATGSVSSLRNGASNVSGTFPVAEGTTITADRTRTAIWYLFVMYGRGGSHLVQAVDQQDDPTGGYHFPVTLFFDSVFTVRRPRLCDGDGLFRTVCRTGCPAGCGGITALRAPPVSSLHSFCFRTAERRLFRLQTRSVFT